MSVDVFDHELDRLREHLETGPGGFWARVRRSRPAFVVLTISIAVLQLRGLPAKLSSTTLDAAAIVQARTAPTHVSLVTIDDKEYFKLFKGMSPLDPIVLGTLLTGIAKGRPALIVVDLETSHPMFRTLPAPRDTKTLWGVNNESDSKHSFMPGKPLGGAEMAPAWSGALAVIPNDQRGIVRGYWRTFPSEAGGFIPSIEFAAAKIYRGEPLTDLTIKQSDNERLLDFRYRFYPISAQFVLDNAKLPGWADGVLHNKVVILGGTYQAARDRYATPVGLADGPEIVAQATEAEIEDTGIPVASPWVAGFFQLLAGIGIVLVYERFNLRTALISSLVLIPVLSLAASVAVFHRLAMWGALIPVLVAVLLTELYCKAAFFLSVCTKLSTTRHLQSEATAAEKARTS